MHGIVRSLDSVLCEGKSRSKKGRRDDCSFHSFVGECLVLGKQSRHSVSLVFMGHAWLFCGEKLWKDGERRAVGKAS